jgi:hypothetical protein
MSTHATLGSARLPYTVSQERPALLRPLLF